MERLPHRAPLGDGGLISRTRRFDSVPLLSHLGRAKALRLFCDPPKRYQRALPSQRWVSKYLATSTPLEREWTNSRVIDGGLVDFVRQLKGRPGGDIGIHGSISVTRTLLERV
jgi:hypothetical protein